jgi:hypothetical protein
VHLFRPSLGFLAEAQPRIKRHFLAEVYINFFRHPHELQSKKTSLKNLQIYFILYFFRIDKFINTY